MFYRLFVFFVSVITIGGSSNTFAEEQVVHEPVVIQLQPDTPVDISANLNKVISVDFDAQPLQTILAHIVSTADIQMTANWVQMANVGVEPNLPITLHMKNAPVAQVLDWVMKKASENNELDPIRFDIQNGIVHVSTRRHIMRDHQQIAVYNIGDIIERYTSSVLNAQAKLAIMEERFKEIKELIRTQVGKQYDWVEFGGDAAMVSHFDTKLIVKAHPDIQIQLKQLLSELRDNRNVVRLEPMPEDQPNEVDLKLKQTIKLNLHKTKLQDVMANLSQMTGIAIEMDWRHLNDVGVQDDMPITLTLDTVTAGEALMLILQHAQAYNPNEPLWFDTTSHNITVSTKRWLFRTNAILRSYDVRHLLIFLKHTTVNQELNEQQIHDQSVLRITALIQSMVEPAMWDQSGNSGSSIRELNGLLLVQAHRSMHRQITQLLQAMAYHPPVDLKMGEACKAKAKAVEK